MTKKKKPKPLSDKAYEFIRQQIIKGVYSQGSRLVVNTLARKLDLSSTPINEALAALEREGLVVASQFKGYTVCTLSTSDVEDLYAVREAIEALVVRLAMEKDHSALAGRLEEILSEENKAVEDMDFSRFGDLDYAFHNVVWTISDNIYANRFEKVINGHMHLILAAAAKTAGRF
ncbi:MAG: GntR family transcriptional regulator, partial [Desulfarculaceae bacterium]